MRQTESAFDALIGEPEQIVPACFMLERMLIRASRRWMSARADDLNIQGGILDDAVMERQTGVLSEPRECTAGPDESALSESVAWYSINRYSD